MTEQNYVCLLYMLSCDFSCYFYVAVTWSILPSVHDIQTVSGKQKGLEKPKLVSTSSRAFLSKRCVSFQVKCSKLQRLIS